jgi:hypothetical protein
MASWRLRVEAESFDWSTGAWSIDRVVVDATTEADALANYGPAVAQFIADRPDSPRWHLRAHIERRPNNSDVWIKRHTIHHHFADH